MFRFQIIEVKPPVKIWLLITGLFWLLFTPAFTRADAFISEDRVYYGADSYTIDYEKEIIHAKGNAYFTKDDKKVKADRIEIYYAGKKKKALFFRNVVVQDQKRKSEVRGDFGEALYRENLYRIEGNAVYTDPERTVQARLIEKRGEEETVFSGNVFYRDTEYEIGASQLKITARSASFISDVEVLQLASGDRVHCSILDYSMPSRDITFQGEVVYLQKDGGESNSPLIMKSKGIRYFHDQDMFLLLGDVLIMTSDVSMNTDVARYRRRVKKLEATGDVVVRKKNRYVYCNNLEYDFETGKLIYSHSVRGIVPIKEESQE
ncbi:MAG: hypothetical protein AMS17_19210 [Spirochaetes bacterium DG_61]|nr:MAG: hypothetical protein AMS17_19210 [Spirochaetes bacterium DG_61]